MTDLIPKDSSLIILGLTSTILYDNYVRRMKLSPTLKALYERNSLAESLSLIIWGAIIFIEFRNFKWWIAILDLVVSIILSIVTTTMMGRLISTKLIHKGSLLLMLLSLLLLAINIF